MLGLEPILEWKMTDREAVAYKICLLWVKTAREFFPGAEVGRLPKHGDPRKSNLFRHAWKMARDTQGYGLKENEIALYIRSQCEMLKAIKVGDRHVRIGPNCLTGEKAWIRWKMWRRQFTKARERTQHTTTDTTTPTYKIALDLDKTRAFLVKKFGYYPTLNDLTVASHDGRLAHWVSLGHVSPYYVLLSPRCYEVYRGRALKDEIPTVSFELFKRDIDPAAIEEFRKRFPEELST